MTRSSVERWGIATAVAGVLGVASLSVAAMAGGLMPVIATFGWVVAGVGALLVGWRLRVRAAELVAVCRSFRAGDYDRRAAMPDGALAALGVTLNELGSHLQATSTALTRSQELLDAALGALEEGVACIDRLDHVVYANRAYGSLVGATQVIGRPFYTQLADAGLAQAVAAVRRNEIAEPVRLLWGRTHLHAKAVAGNGEVVVLVLYDRTRIERLEQRRRDFTAAVSHELKTPLTSILGFAETALDDAELELATARAFMERIHHQAERLTVLVRDVLTLSRLEEGEWKGRPERFDLVALADELLDDVRATAARTGVRLERLGAASLEVEHDAELIRMLLSNLVSNAIRYNRPDGTVWLRLFAEGDARARIEIEDTGIGIPPEHRERVFERFYRVDSHRSRQSGGTGLGLSIVKHLLQRLDGRIDLRSGPHGTCFTIHLPAGPAPGASIPGDEPDAGPGRV